MILCSGGDFYRVTSAAGMRPDPPLPDQGRFHAVSFISLTRKPVLTTRLFIPVETLVPLLDILNQGALFRNLSCLLPSGVEHGFDPSVTASQDVFPACGDFFIRPITTPEEDLKAILGS
jgi:hypothetical protein